MGNVARRMPQVVSMMDPHQGSPVVSCTVSINHWRARVGAQQPSAAASRAARSATAARSTMESGDARDDVVASMSSESVGCVVCGNALLLLLLLSSASLFCRLWAEEMLKLRVERKAYGLLP